MGPIVRVGAPAPTHDLLRVRSPTAARVEGPVPAWVESALRQAPWVVVRRGYVRAGLIPVGVRGPTRAQRCAAWLAVADVAERRSPEELWNDTGNGPALAPATTPIREEKVPAMSALARIAPLLAPGYRWGPGGSVGFELATGVATANASSDLDVVLRQPHRFEPTEARALYASLVEAAAPARIDALLETAWGGVSLAELATEPVRVLLRTPDGPRLVPDPWTAGAWAERAS